MGKYMRKGKVSGEVAVMEVPGGALLGVRTRSRTLAMQRAQRPPEKGEVQEEAEKGEYLELRSRRLEKPPQVPHKGMAHAARRVGERRAAAAADDNDDVEGSFGENVLDLDAAMERSARETTPCSLIRTSDTISTPGSTTKSRTSSMTSHRRMEASVCRYIPSSVEMEEFFAAAEQREQDAFREKYNFCPVNDCPLPGRYEWSRIDY